MSQIRYYNYLTPLESFTENQRILGSVFPGRVCGWDTVSFIGTTGTMSNAASGIQKTNLVPISKDGPMGLVVSSQGTFVFENANDVSVNVDFNAANAFERIDLLVMTHEHVESGGGSPATYSVIKGGLGGPVEPGLSNIYTQVKVGTFRVAPSAADHSLTTFSPIEPTAMGGYVPVYRQQSGESLPNNPHELGDFDRMTTPGIYVATSITTNRPNTDTGTWRVEVSRRGVNVFQSAASLSDGKMFTRTSSDTGATWTAWANHQSADLSSLEGAIGATSLAALDYSSNNYVTDATSLETAVGALDTALKTSNDNIGDLNYLEQNYITNGQSLSDSMDLLDQQLKNVTDDVATNLSSIGTNASNISNNASNIGTNATNIGTNATGIGVNATAISGKQATITGAATTIASVDLSADRVLISNGSGKVAQSGITPTELAYLDGVTSDIQPQLDTIPVPTAWSNVVFANNWGAGGNQGFLGLRSRLDGLGNVQITGTIESSVTGDYANATSPAAATLIGTLVLAHRPALGTRYVVPSFFDKLGVIIISNSNGEIHFVDQLIGSFVGTDELFINLTIPMV
jgi:hypothetical protein